MGDLLILITMVMQPAGIIFAAIGVLILIIRLIKKKTKFVLPIILIVIGGALLVGTKPFAEYAFKTYYAEKTQAINEKYVIKEQYAKKDANGKIYYEIGNFSAVDDNGNVFDNNTLAQYKYTFINLWEPWCGPCKQELDDLQKLYLDYKDKGINFVGIYYTEKDAQSVLSEHGITYTTVLLSKEEYKNILDTFSVGSVPLSFVLDSEGKLVNVGMPEKDLMEVIGQNAPEYLTEFANSVSLGPRTYDFWAQRFDAILK